MTGRVAAPWATALRTGAAVLILLLAACGQPKHPALPAGSPVLVLGDSITAGYGVAPEDAWPARLAAATGWQMINAGVSGDTSADALARLPELLERHAPRLVLVEIGGNDMLHRIPESEIAANLDQILAQIAGRGAQPVLIGIPRPSVLGAAFARLSPAEFYEETARRNRVPLIGDAASEVLSAPDLKLDPLHPNSAGHARLAEAAREALAKLGLVR
jgi:acyl-CoA hydrolase